MALSSRRLRHFSRPFLLVLLGLFLVVSRFIPPLAQFQNSLFHSVFTPLLSGVSKGWGQVSGLFHHYVFLVGASQENEQLKTEKAQLQNQVRDLEEREEALERERGLSESLGKFNKGGAVARVLAFDPLKSSKSLLIGRGSENGVEKGQAVLAGEGVVGVVVNTTPHDAQVLLLTDPHAAVDGEVRPSGARGILHGERVNLSLNRDFWLTRMEYLGVNQEVHDEDVVTTSGLDQVFPPGVPIGKIQKVARDEKGLFLSAQVLPAVDFSKLREVMVIVGPKEEVGSAK